MKTKYKILIILVFVLILVAVRMSANLFLGGSYSYAEQYEFDVNNATLIRAVKRLKNENPNYKMPDSLTINDSSYMGKYHFYIYYSKENEIVHCFIMDRIDNPNKTSIYLDGINKGLVLGSWKVVNSDYDKSENLKIKEEFKERVLNKLKLPYKDEGDGMMAFWP